MDPYKLLSRSTNLSKGRPKQSRRVAPSDGPPSHPQLFASRDEAASSTLGKRKRDTVRKEADPEDFFNERGKENGSSARQKLESVVGGALDEENDDAEDEGRSQPRMRLSIEERKSILHQHKVKVTWLNSQQLLHPTKRPKGKKVKAEKPRHRLFPEPLQALRNLGQLYGVSGQLQRNIIDQSYDDATEVQLAAIPLLLNTAKENIPELAGSTEKLKIDLLAVAPTGSGKTLAFLIPLLHSVISRRHQASQTEHQTSAIILAPTKELAAQITNEGRKLAKGCGVTVSQMRKGLKLPTRSSSTKETTDDSQDVDDVESTGSVLRADIIVSAPGLLQNAMAECRDLSWQIHHMILDEADVLLDPAFREQTLDIWNALNEPELRVSLWSATMGSNIEDLARSTIDERSQRLASTSTPAPLVRLVVGLKDSAVPNVSHQLIYAATEKGKLMGLRQLLHPTTTTKGASQSLRPPFLIFTQTVERAIALNSELLYDVPAEAGGSSRIAVLHSDLSDTARDSIMTRFRKGEIWVLITTDLLSRGVDFRGVNGVVNYDIPTSSAAYVHRIGRTGRAGRDGGVAVTLYSKEDMPYLKHVANVVSMAQKQQGTEGGVDDWLLAALPKLSKRDKKNLKTHGIESRTARGQIKDPKAARQSRISTKAGFVRRVENNRKGAILGSQRRAQINLRTADDDDEEGEFGGFD
ncbi:P-loop containing nucleoside triphosphate hydrolase protein [Neohortaea acidophila]|uniref:ATP-dependent RNA helicase n=1 Tax=Neohortaea acidophila TaxID=245834 RepID=A0A6A6PTZ6_9PEZI|nr:P-loop containing nucleoside triphosphate hydrolase protein [Neohortaea acidophila]KAF2483589.1 P-loop containing nucleoside triphosphate hydrolase protein [Neohortaea acidophila]